MSIEEKYLSFCQQLEKGVQLIAVSKTKPESDILELYNCGCRDFGENYVQELVSKHESLPKDIHWHFIGHLQSNKVKYIAPFVYLIHGVDSLKLLKEIQKQAVKFDRTIECLLQVHIAQEETKFGFSKSELMELISVLNENSFGNIKIVGLMGMASNTEDEAKVRGEFRILNGYFQEFKKLENDYFIMKNLSMGMSGDYKIAIEEGSNMIRVGSLIFGERNYNQ